MEDKTVKLSVTDCEALYAEASGQLREKGEVSFKGAHADILVDILGIFLRILGFLEHSRSFGSKVRQLFSLANRKSENSKKK